MEEKKKNYIRSPCELFEEIKNVSNPEQHLKENLSYGVKFVLQLNFTDKIKLDLPKGAPNYRSLKVAPDLAYQRFDNAVKKLLFCTVDSKIDYHKKQKIFLEFLESICNKDANIVIAAKDKKLNYLYPHITLDLISKSCPEILF